MATPSSATSSSVQTAKLQPEPMERDPRGTDAFRLTRSTGALKDYLNGLDHLRERLSGLEADIKKGLDDFYNCKDGTEEDQNMYLKGVSANFMDCNHGLAAKGAGPVIVDGQSQIAAIINSVKEHGAVIGPDVVQELSDFWENVKFAVEALQTVGDKFEKGVFERLKDAGRSYMEAGSKKSFMHSYPKESSEFANDLETTLRSFRLLAASSGNKMNLELISKSSLLDRLLRNCDDETYPLLQLIPDLTVKLENLFRIARKWLDRDEKYIFDISEEIREKKNETKEKEESLRAERDKHTQMMKKVKSAYLMCQNSKRKLKELAAELARLESQVAENSVHRKTKEEEKLQKESMADFLQLSISQTRKNYNLQLKRQRLLRQVKELEKNLEEIAENINQLKQDINTKASERVQVQEKATESQHTYTEIKQELESFTSKVHSMAQELRAVRSSLTDLEVIQNCKTRPEMVDDFYDRPRTVKLAASLREKIEMKRGRIAQPTLGSSAPL